MAEQFSLTDNEVTRAPLLDLSVGAEPSHTPSFLDSQAVKLHLALQDQSPGLDEVSSAVLSGNTETYRRLLADREVASQIESRNDVLNSILQADPSAVTPEVIDVVRGLSNSEVSSPDVADVIERKYSELYTNTAAASLDNGILEDAMEEDPEAAYNALDLAEVKAYKNNIYGTLQDEANKAIEDQSLVGTAWNLAENMLLGSYQTHRQIQNVSGTNEDFFSDALPGTDRIEQYAYLDSITDPKEWRRVLYAVRDDLSARNPYSWKEWLDGYESFGNFNKYVTTLGATLDIVTAPGLGLATKALKGAGKAVEAAQIASKVSKGEKVQKLETALQGVVKGSTKNPQKVEEIAKDLGKFDDSATGYVIKDLMNGSFASPRNVQDLSNSTPSLSDPLRILRGYDNAPQAAYNRMKEAVLNRADIAGKFLRDVNLPDTATPDELIEYASILRRDYMKENPRVSKNVIDVQIAPEGDIGNVYQAKVILGQRDGTLFESEKQARNYFKRWIKGTDDFQIEQVGQGFQIAINKNVDQSRIASDIALGTSQRTPISIVDNLSSLSWLRTPTEQLSGSQNVARAVSTSSKEMFDTFYSRMAEPFGKLTKNEGRELSKILQQNTRDMRYQDDVGEFTEKFYKTFNKNPSENQIDAYLSSLQINDLDLWLRDLSVYKQKARAGVEQMKTRVTLKKGQSPEDVEFEGRVVQNLPYNLDQPFRIGIIKDGELKSSKFSTTMSDTDRQMIRKMQDEGYLIVNATDPDFNIGKKYYDYLVVRDLNRNRIGVKNFERQEGGHKIYKDQFFLKQAQISGDDELRFYRGDKTWFNFKSQREADEFAPVLEEARMKLLKGDKDAFSYIRDNLPIPLKEFIAAVQKGDIDLNIPFVVTRSGQRTIDTGKLSHLKNLRDSTRSEHKLQITGRFLGERNEGDLSTIVSEAGTGFRIEPAPLLDPMEALSTSMSNSINLRAFDDYKLMTRDEFLREFSDLLADSPETLRVSGFDPVMNPVFKTGIEAQQPQRVQRAKNVSRAFRNFVSTQDPVSAKIETLKEQIVAKAVPSLSKISSRGAQWLEGKAINEAPNPGVWLRSVAFDFKMGFWNPWQYFKQANSMVNVAAVGGVNGMKSGVLYPFMRAALKTGKAENILELGKRAEQIGLMKAEDFAESMALYKKSGFNSIGHDLAYLDDLRSPELRVGPIRGTVNKVKSTSTMPFMEGERMTRLAGWNTAYMEKKAALNGKKLTKRDEAEILYRAKMLVGNMSRESNAAWQKGYLGTMTQFFSYQARIMDQFLGKQLSPAERGRLFLGYSAAYGVPVAAAGTLGVIPIRDFLIDKMNEEGWDTNDPAMSFFMDGFVSGMTNLMFDKKWNISSSYGPGGIPTFYDFLSGDKEAAEMFLGAGGGIAWTTLRDTTDLFRVMASEWSDFDGGLYNLTLEDVVKPLRNITTIDSLMKVYQVHNTGIWATKNGYNLMEMDLPEAVFSVLTGLTDQSMEDAFSKSRATKGEKEWFKEKQKELIQEIKRIQRMEDSTTRDEHIKAMKVRMMVEYGFTNREAAQTWKYATDQSLLVPILQENYQKVLDRLDRKLAAQAAQQEGSR